MNNLNFTILQTWSIQIEQVFNKNQQYLWHIYAKVCKLQIHFLP